MSVWLAQFIVRASAWFTPRAQRVRWREEWLAEIDADHRSRGSVVGRALGAPIDAALLRADSIRASAHALRAGARSDLHQTWRALLRSPRHVTTVILCLTIGITVSVAVFSFINSLLYGEVPGIVDRKNLVRLFVTHDQVYGAERIGRQGMVAAGSLSRSDFEVLTATPDATFVNWAAEGNMNFAVSFRDQPVGVMGAFVSPRYFETLGTLPFKGRLLARHDDEPGVPSAAVIGFHLWHDRFGAADDVIGQPLLVGTCTYTIVGIAPPRFTGMQPTDIAAYPGDSTQLWLPMRDAETWPGAPSSMSTWLSVRGRLAPGRTMPDATVSLQAAAARLSAAYPNERRNASFPVSSYGFGPNDTPLDVLIVIALFLAVPLSVLAIGCANVANLQLARATERARELAVRLALGASRGQIVRLLCLEAAVLAVFATSIGWGASALILSAADNLFPLTVTLALDRRILIFAVVLAAGITVLAGLAPGWLVARRSTASGLQQSDRAGGLGHSRLRNSLVIVQVAASLVLLIMAGLFAESVRAMQLATPAVYKEQVVAYLDLNLLSYTPAERTHLFHELSARLSSDARVRGVAAEQLTGFRYRRVGAADVERKYSDGGYVTVGWGEATGRRLVTGRWLRAEDGADAALVSERFAQRIGLAESIEIETSAGSPRHVVRIVGVVADLQRRPDIVIPDPAIYISMPATMPDWFTVRIRTDAPAMMADGVRQVLRNIDPRLPWERVQTAEAQYLRDVGPLRYLALSVGGFGVIAMLLAAGGLFAVTAYVVSLRTREIGIRVAIGADRRDVVRLVMRQSLRLATIGAVVGVVLAVPLAFVMQALFIGASPVDALAIVPPVVMMLLVATAAAALPARRAASIDPVRALRAD